MPQEIKDTSLPLYKEIIKTIGQQLWSRKKLLLTRTFWLISPLFIGFLIISIGGFIVLYSYEKSPTAFLGAYLKIFPRLLPVIVLFLSWMLFSLVYYIVMNWIFGVEKKIWVISYFDKKNLTSKESWSIARKLSIPVFKFGFKIFRRFYLIPLLIFVLSIVSFFILGALSQMPPNFLEKAIPFFIGIWTIELIVFSIYYYLLQVKKLRFIWFLFLDCYGKRQFSFKQFLELNKKMNEINKTEMFKKVLVINLGADTLEAITQSTFNLLEEGARKIAGDIGRASAQPLRLIGKEISSQTISFGKMIAIFMLYNDARFILDSNPREPNKFIYSFIK